MTITMKYQDKQQRNKRCLKQYQNKICEITNEYLTIPGNEHEKLAEEACRLGAAVRRFLR